MSTSLTAIIVALSPTITVIVTFLLNRRGQKTVERKVTATHRIIERRDPNTNLGPEARGQLPPRNRRKEDDIPPRG